MKKLNYKTLVKLACMMLACLQSFACSSSDIDKDISDHGNNTLFKPNYNRNSVFRNPMNGWVMYAARTADAAYWDTEFYVSNLGKKVKAIDYASACYIRTSWASMNPREGVYSWRDPNSQIGKLIKGAEERGLPIAFRFVVDGQDQGLNTPQFVFDAGAKYYMVDSKFPDRLSPYPQDPVFQKYYVKFIQALAEDFNDPDRTAFIDGYGLGKWGEGHGVIYEDPNTSTGANTEKLKEEVMNWITDVYTQYFTKVPLLMTYHRVIGDPASDGAVNPNSAHLLELAINKGYSLRQDAFGMTDYYQAWEKEFAKTWNFKRPIVMEGGWIISSHRYWLDSGGKYREGHPEDVRQGEFDASAEAHVNMMDFRAGSETLSWFENSFPLVQRFVSEGGYRLYPDQIYLPEEIKRGTEVTLSSRWRNMGWGYLPNNIPQWNYKYKVAFALLDAAGEVKKVLVDKDSEPSNWLKDKPVTYDFKTTVDVPAGTYSWAIAIVDTSKDNQPGITLAVNETITNDGWMKLLDVHVQ
ncbi:hypothetical protein GCM10023231_34900 [Olivibacter ginsenosidimutans]|uniref:DUF4832 domain-containing protein n=1 Tax=Olivibacter ginsenosidimutans TaxID=1176537 RepID=A0ABP9C2R8_9SPHI